MAKAYKLFVLHLFGVLAG